VKNKQIAFFKQFIKHWSLHCGEKS